MGERNAEEAAEKAGSSNSRTEKGEDQNVEATENVEEKKEGESEKEDEGKDKTSEVEEEKTKEAEEEQSTNTTTDAQPQTTVAIPTPNETESLYELSEMINNNNSEGECDNSTDDYEVQPGSHGSPGTTFIPVRLRACGSQSPSAGQRGSPGPASAGTSAPGAPPRSGLRQIAATPPLYPAPRPKEASGQRSYTLCSATSSPKSLVAATRTQDGDTKWHSSKTCNTQGTQQQSPRMHPPFQRPALKIGKRAPEMAAAADCTLRDSDTHLDVVPPVLIQKSQGTCPPCKK